jgi:hypothetical protein
MSNNSYLAELRAGLVTETRRIGLVESERVEALNRKRCKQKKFWQRMFLATTLIASNPFHVSVVHGSIRPAQTQWNTETSNLALGTFTEKVAKSAEPKLVQVADRGGKGGGKSNGGGGKSNGGGGASNRDGNAQSNTGGGQGNTGGQGGGTPDNTHSTDKHGDHNENTAGGDGETGVPNPGGVIHTDDSTETPHGDLVQADPQGGSENPVKIAKTQPPPGCKDDCSPPPGCKDDCPPPPGCKDDCPPSPPPPPPPPEVRNNPCDGADNCGTERRTKNVKPVVEDNIVSVHG